MGNILPVLTTPGIKRAFVIVALFMMFQQITGINIPFYYGPTVIANLHIFGSTSGTYLSNAVFGIEASSILAIINVLATLIGFRLIDSYGRRSLGLLGYAGMAFFDILGTIIERNIYTGNLLEHHEKSHYDKSPFYPRGSLHLCFLFD